MTQLCPSILCTGVIFKAPRRGSNLHTSTPALQPILARRFDFPKVNKDVNRRCITIQIGEIDKEAYAYLSIQMMLVLSAFPPPHGSGPARILNYKVQVSCNAFSFKGSGG